VLPDDRPHVDLVLRRLKKLRDAQDGGGSADTPTAADVAAAASGSSEPEPSQRSASTGKPAHALCDDVPHRGIPSVDNVASSACPCRNCGQASNRAHPGFHVVHPTADHNSRA